MKTIFRIALFAASCSLLPAAPVTWYLNNVTFTDGGRAFGNFTFDAATNTFSAVNIQTTQGPSTTLASTAIGGGSYTVALVPNANSPVAFISGGIGTNVRRLQILPGLAPLAAAASLALSGTEGFC